MNQITQHLKQRGEETQKLAELFHDTYETLAPAYGYETREDTKVFDPNSKNGKLMIAVCGAVEAQSSQLLLEKVMEVVEGMKCRRCSMPISECSKGRWEKPMCVVGNTEWDEHVIGLPDIRTAILEALNK